MKKILLLAITTCICMTAFSKAADPTRAKCSIYGVCQKSLDRNGKVVYKLSDVRCNGFSFDVEKDSIWWGQYDAERGDVVFRFQKASTTYPGGLKGNNLDFWTYDDEIDEWQHDIEVRQGTSETKMTKKMSIMLVLDYSQSVGTTGVEVIKESAKTFIDSIYRVSQDGNVQIGIIKFNTKKYTDEHTFNITPLNKTSYMEMMNFIEDQAMDKGTALYYSIDKGITMMENAAKKIPVNKYAGSYMVIFTDGLDNVSSDNAKGLMSIEQYYDYVKHQLQSTVIHGQRIEARLVALKGTDITTDKQYEKFTTKMKGLCDNDKFHEIREFHELQKMFGKFATDLVDSWTSLACFIPEGRMGKVCWTLGEVELVDEIGPKRHEQPKEQHNQKAKTKQLLLGVDLGGGCGMQDDFGGYWSVGTDFAYPITQKFGLGAYLAFGQGIYNVGNQPAEFYMAGGVQMTIGDYTNKRACLIGIGGGIDAFASMADIRIGGIWKNGFFFYGELGLGSAYINRSSSYNDYNDYYYDYYYYYYSPARRSSGGSNEVFAFDIGIHIGYNFGRFIKCK